MAEWSMAAVLKTVDRKVRGFESCSLRQNTIQQHPKKCINPLEIAGFLLLTIRGHAIISIDIRQFWGHKYPKYAPKKMRCPMSEMFTNREVTKGNKYKPDAD